MTITVTAPADLAGVVGRSATGPWSTVDQRRIDLFADATDDHQWIHVDPERAAAGPFGGTVAHGFLTLALVPALTEGLLDVGGTSAVVNYGLDKVRFLQPVRAGSRVRATTTVRSAEPSPQGWRVAADVTVEVEGADRPALVAATIALYVPAPDGA
ncbi:MaoC family dehydratase [Cellulomonas fimi]|uniref:Enoyl-CoA hydratase n=1 Tax=Cellulomonas fimi (strain ATCC 484 / DSM 20113 / JCM 1341 / CCUG 24087 / LMG 16345 / NBRC 15513 / NCIMB 8980 / NCTC 7547 / NRS-133) TaxID=590998 RepID=F4H622_CELFA|nr:MaoC family dehydratase [Cellulomonas fimi]AEE46752.1 Enoyl-CoA hydratase [Cellulomonas fimi ATCC 484]NNH07603.1 MaoC family dehydratase [Cellulomonas fimi]VEH34081.1 Probable enoyl-CoA hydratase 1 [Cellulomonas fimi]